MRAPKKDVREIPPDLVEYTVQGGYVYCVKTGKHVGVGETAWVTPEWLSANAAPKADGVHPLRDVAEYDYSRAKPKSAPKRPAVRRE